MIPSPVLMRHHLTAAAVLQACLLACAFAGEGADPPPARSWDLSSGPDVRQVQWPRPTGGSGIAFADFDVRGRVLIKLPDGRSYDGHAERVSFAAIDGRLLWVAAFTEPVTRDAVLARVGPLVRDWGLQEDRLADWNARNAAAPDRSPGGNLLLQRSFGGRAVGIEVRHAFDEGRPYLVSFTYSWGLKPETQPTTTTSTTTTSPAVQPEPRTGGAAPG